MQELSAQQCSAKTELFGRLNRLRRLMVLSTVCCGLVGLPESVEAKPSAPAKQEKIILSFPNKQCGKLFVISENAVLEQGDIPTSLFAVARGNVNVPANMKLQFDVGNAVIGDLSFIKSLNPKPIASIRFRMQEVMDEQFPNLASLTETERIDADGTEIGDRGLASLSNLKKMQYLRVSRSQVHGDSFGAFAGWDRLAVMLLSYNDLKPGCLKKLPRLKKLWKLDLFSTGIGDSDLADLKGLPLLTELKLGRNQKITDKGINTILSMSKLQLLDLSFTSVTAEGLKRLKAMPKLLQLTVDLERLKPVDVYHLRRALPKCQIVDALKHTSVPIDFFK